MGRVEEAMRRAAEARGERFEGTATDTGVGADTLMDESFPFELRPRAPRPAPPDAHDGDDDFTVRRPAAPAHSGRLIDSTDRRLIGKLVADHTMPAACREQYRRLAATLHHTQVDHGLKVVMIASAVAGEGKTLTATNLALTFSESYRRSVLLIDADLRRPSVHGVFKIEGEPGLSEGLMTVEQQKFTLHQISERLTILPAGRPSSDPMAGLTSGRMRRLIAEARDAFDWVIIDTPPVGLMTDANLLAAMADGAVLVVKAGSTSYQLVQRAVSAIGRDRLLGAVLNRADVGTFGGHGYYYNYYYGGREEHASLPQRLLGKVRDRFPRFGRKDA